MAGIQSTNVRSSGLAAACKCRRHDVLLKDAERLRFERNVGDPLLRSRFRWRRQHWARWQRIGSARQRQALRPSRRCARTDAATQARSFACALPSTAAAGGSGSICRLRLGTAEFVRTSPSLAGEWPCSLTAASGTAAPSMASARGRTRHSGRQSSAEPSSGIVQTLSRLNAQDGRSFGYGSTSWLQQPSRPSKWPSAQVRRIVPRPRWRATEQGNWAAATRSKWGLSRRAVRWARERF